MKIGRWSGVLLSELLIVSGVWYLMSGMTWRSEIAAFMCKHFYCAERNRMSYSQPTVSVHSQHESSTDMDWDRKLECT